MKQWYEGNIGRRRGRLGMAVAGLIAAKIMDRAQPTVGTVH